MKQTPQNPQEWQDKAIFWAIALAFIVLLFSVVAISVVNIWQVVDRPKPQVDTTDAQAILDRANDAVDSASLVLNFLEGASVIVAVALGAAAFYGYRETQQLRQELTDKLREIEQKSAELDAALLQKGAKVDETLVQKRQEVDEALGEVKTYLPDMRRFIQQLPSLLETHNTLKTTIDDVALLLQADQEFRHRNFSEAYQFAKRVLDDDPNNILALYICGWIEVHYMDNGVDSGIENLRLAVRRSDQLPFRWQTARATYGVALRRKALSIRANDPKTFEDLMNQAEGHLKVALGHNRRLVDFNRESFWGPMGGLHRDMGRIEDSIQSYETALEVTPGSSYPQGNLAALYLHQVKYRGMDENKALDTFETTRNGAQLRVASIPNDFFLLMDIAMSSTILLRRDPHTDKVRAAQQVFERALNMRISAAQREVNCRGWCFLLEHCPEGDGWGIVQQELQARVHALDCYCKKGE